MPRTARGGGGSPLLALSDGIERQLRAARARDSQQDAGGGDDVTEVASAHSGDDDVAPEPLAANAGSDDDADEDAGFPEEEDESPPQAVEVVVLPAVVVEEEPEPPVQPAPLQPAPLPPPPMMHPRRRRVVYRDTLQDISRGDIRRLARRALQGPIEPQTPVEVILIDDGNPPHSSPFPTHRWRREASERVALRGDSCVNAIALTSPSLFVSRG